MAKISPVSAKYIIHATIEIEGVVDRPDVIGAIFGQTEGLLGADLELRELQRSGRIGRIEVNVDTRSGKTRGSIIIPSSLDKAETAIVGAALEVIQRIGPCNAKLRVEKIEDVRVSKRSFVIERAKELLKHLMDDVMPDSQELADEVSYSVRVMEITQYGKDRLPAGPAIDESDEVIVVEGRADVLNLLKHGFKNVISLNGTSVPETIIELGKRKTLTVFVDGDRGGDLILKELMGVAEIDFVTRAPDGKEVEEITKKEIHKALRSKVASEQVRLESGSSREQYPPPRRNDGQRPMRPQQDRDRDRRDRDNSHDNRDRDNRQKFVQKRPQQPQQPPVTEQEKNIFKGMLEDLIGTRGAYILDDKLSILGKVPSTELITTIQSLSAGVYAIVLDGEVDKNLIQISEKVNVRFLVGMETKARQAETRIRLITVNDL